jgi:hypothetical protein
MVRLHRQVVEARDRLDALLDSKEAALEGRGVAPSPKEIDRARAALETAEALLRAAEQDGGE